MPPGSLNLLARFAHLLLAAALRLMTIPALMATVVLDWGEIQVATRR